MPTPFIIGEPYVLTDEKGILERFRLKASVLKAKAEYEREYRCSFKIIYDPQGEYKEDAK